MMANCLQQLQPEEEVFPNRVFLGGLDRKFTELQLETFFSELGPVVDVRIVCDRKTGLSKGYGFVTFEDTAVTNELIEQGSIEYMGKTLRVRPAVRRKGHGQFQDEKTNYLKSSQSQGLQPFQDNVACIADVQFMGERGEKLFGYFKDMEKVIKHYQCVLQLHMAKYRIYTLPISCIPEPVVRAINLLAAVALILTFSKRKAVYSMLKD